MTGGATLSCSLDASEAQKRLAEMAALGRSSLIASEIRGAQAVLRFSAEPEVRDRLGQIVAGERKCCGFLTFTLTDDGGIELALTIDAPAGAEPALRDLADAFAASPGAA